MTVAIKLRGRPAADKFLAKAGKYVRLHGVTTTCTLEYEETNGDNVISCTFHGNLLALAVFMGNEKVALEVLALGSYPTAYSYAREGWFGWSEETCHPVWKAAQLGMREAAKGILACGVNMDWRPHVDSDEGCSGKALDTLATLIRDNDEMREFFASIGHDVGSRPA